MVSSFVRVKLFFMYFSQGTALEVQAEDAKDKVSRINNALEQNLEVQQLLRDELTKKNEELAFHTTTIDGQDRQIAYLKAEIAAMKTKLTQYDQAEESNEELTQRLQQQVEQLEEANQQLQLQVEYFMLIVSHAKIRRSHHKKKGGGEEKKKKIIWLSDIFHHPC